MIKLILTKNGILAADLYPLISPNAILLRIRLCNFKIYSFCDLVIFTITRSVEHAEPNVYRKYFFIKIKNY